MNGKLIISLLLIAVFSSFSELKAQTSGLNLPTYVKNSSEDINVNKNATLQFSLFKDGRILFKEKSFDGNLKETIDKHLEGSFQLRYAYIKSDTDTKVENLLNFSKNLAETGEIREIRLVVIPFKLTVIPSENVQKTLEKRSQGYTLNLILSSKEIDKKEAAQKKQPPINADTDEPPPPVKNVKTKPTAPPRRPTTNFKAVPLVVEREDYYGYKLNGTKISENNLAAAISREFKRREENNFFRSGTNQIDKSITVRVAPKLEYKYLVSLVDWFYGLGADKIYLQIDAPAK